MKSLSRVRLFVTPWTVAHQAPLSMGFSRQEHWSGLPFPSPGGLPSPGIEPASPALAGGFFTSEPPGKPLEAVLVVPRPVPRHCINVKSGFSRRSDLLKDTQVAVDRTVAETPFQPLSLSRCNGGGFFLSVFLCR